MYKKNLLMTTALCLSLMVQAQFIEAVSYRGAFAPAPAKMWTDSWVNWDPQNAPYGASTVTITGSITVNTTWTSNNVYLLNGVVYVESGATLTIEPGTVIRGNASVANSCLIITRGSKLNASGTACNPIVFTSSRAAGQRSLGDWGGVILLGQARNNLGTNIAIEGLAPDPRNNHGGSNDADNSGVLQYVRIEFGGYVFFTDNEINGLTMGSVGSSTTIDHVQCSFINDDAFEWFGGAVSCKYLVAYRCLDDDFDTDNGFSGKLQYLLGVKDPAIADQSSASTSEGFESDNDNPGTAENRYPKTSASFYNVTMIGAYRCGGPTPDPKHMRGARLRRNTDLKVYNSIFMNSRIGLFIDGALALANATQDSLVFRNNIIAGDYTTYPTHVVAENAATRAVLLNPAYTNDSINTCNLLVSPFNFTSPDYRPNTALAGNPTQMNVQGSPDLTPVIEIDAAVFVANQGRDFLVDLIENNGGTTSGQISFSIAKQPGFDITVPGLTLTASPQSGTNGTSNVNGGTPNSNGNFTFLDNGTSIIVTSKPGIIIAKADLAIIGLRITRKTSTPAGVSQTLLVSIADNAGGDASTPNNSAFISLSTAN